VAELSGGWQKRLTLACGWVQNPDLILYDEPTNHLDLKSILWLQKTLNQSRKAWVLVSHDRYFLDQTLKRTMELNKLFDFGFLSEPCGYTRFMEKREAFLEQQAQSIESLRNKVRRETEWLRRSPKARTTKAKFRIDAANELIQQLEMMNQRHQNQKAALSFTASNRKTRKLLSVDHISKGWDGCAVISHLDLLLSPGKRLGLLGTNGSGKTTLLKLLAGILSPDGAPHLNLVYFDQERRQIDPDLSVARALSGDSDQIIYRGQPVHIASWAKRFGITVDQLPLPVRELSGGEQAKLHIARLMLLKADVLLLDEPTNDLDMETVQQLEESLLDFPGAMVLVTHDRFMLNRVCNDYLGLDGQGGVFAVSSFKQWESTLSDDKVSGRKKAQVSRETTQKVKKKLSYNDQREYDAMESRILDIEEKIEMYQSRLEDATIASNGAELSKILNQLQDARHVAERMYERWSELESMVL